MANMKTMDIEAGYAAVAACGAGCDAIGAMFNAVKGDMDNLAGSWHGNSKTQFDPVWEQFASFTNTLTQRLAGIKDNLAREVAEVESAFSQ